MPRLDRMSWSADELARLMAGIGGVAGFDENEPGTTGEGPFSPEEVGRRIGELADASRPQGGTDHVLGRLQAGFAGLPPRDRATVWLWAVERLSPSSVAGVLGSDPALIEGRAAELMGELCRQALDAGGGRLLIAEDERITALELREALEEMGHAVLAVSATAGQAISAASLHEPDLALVDVRLKGGTDGVSAAREIQDALGTPVILMTAYTDQATRAASIQPYGFLAKPWSDEDLRRVLDEALVRIALERNA